ncbi:acyl-CoA synthetase [[Mycobacterium] burgundiense]|uniref:Acyl-CoA synthetase n=1 Tax=[Mycobacterium] burgundiense TaxID=3064286 RepID=A0ABN9MW14_9MYCO|nr:acyl-CoA synthetase [Mycolicibacterium sp. MU0053]CAJ1496034.1 acyl-CoA synthetase [Mycolicibacterium sp. MU0053]
MPDVQFNLALAQEAVSAAVPDREYLIWRDRRFTYSQLTERSRRLASYLHQRGLGARVERDQLAGHESGQDHVALYMRNGNEFIESMLGAFKSRTVPVNVNYRYVADELRYLFGDAEPAAVIYHADFAPTLAQVRDALPDDVVLIQVADDSGHELLPGAVDYEDALTQGAPELPATVTPDDLHIIYTGGTTGMPKAVLWRQHDIFSAAMGGQLPGAWEPVNTYDDLVQRALTTPPMRLMLLPPLMHGAAQWGAFTQINLGGTLVLPDDNTRLDAADVLRVAAGAGASAMMIIGDAMARPLIAELEVNSYDLSTLFLIGSGSVTLSPELKKRLHELLPNVIITDGVGSSETGPQGTYVSTKDSVQTGTFTVGPGARVADETLSELLQPGADSIGWLMQTGCIPLGYLGDREKTERTFPVIDGVRYAVPGDRARLLEDGAVRLLGRDSVTINSGGEKIFAEEVEAAVKSHPSVADVIVTGRPNERWGQEVVALVQVVDGTEFDEAVLAQHAGQQLARYKVPKAWIVVPEVRRSPVGKADYRWANSIATQRVTS